MTAIMYSDLQQKTQEKLLQTPAAPWVHEMLEHYRRTGAFRPQDLRRLLGDPNRAVEVGPNAGLAALFCSKPGSK